MLSIDEQALVMKQAQHLTRVTIQLRAYTRSGAISPKRRDERIALARDRLADLLKEIG